MHPEILAGRFDDEFFDRGRVPLRDVLQRLRLTFPILRPDHVSTADLEFEVS